MLTGALTRSRWVKGLVDFLFPPICAGCGRFYEPTSGICPECLKAIWWYSDPICLSCDRPIGVSPHCPDCGKDSLVLFAAGDYIEPLTDIIHTIKFRRQTRGIGHLCDHLADAFRKRLNQIENAVLVPIPLHPDREYERGYNQAEVIARALKDRLNLPLRTEYLMRVGKRTPQSKLSRHDREANIAGAFEIGEFDPHADESILLVDDVVTSGATIKEAAQTLENAGAKVIGALSLAHGQ